VYAQRINASGEALWTTNGIALSTGYSSFLSSRRAITPDGAGGAIVMWNGSGAPAYVYAQKVNAAGIPQWTANGVIVGTGGNIDVVSDDEGGAIAAYDNNTWIYISRIISSGTVQWNSSVQSFNNLRYPAIASDGMHGAFVAYQADDATDLDIYAQHITASGTVAWPDSGVALFATAAYDNLGEIASDEVGGVIVTSYDNYSRGGDYNVYAQRITASGIVDWQMNGVALCTAASDQRSPVIATTGTGKAIVAWVHGSNYGIHAQSIDSSGSAGTSPPAIQSVLDVPNDQGGCVRIEIARSGLDAELEPTYPVSRYDIWQRVDDPLMLGLVSRVPEGGAAAAAAIAVAAPKSDSPLAERANALIDVGWPLIESGGRFFMRSRELLGTGSFPPGTWELLGSFAATQQNEYIFRAGTLADSTASGIPYSVYIVSAHTTTPTVWYASYPDSGYSVDNLPPEAPGGLLAEQSFSPTGLALSWDLSTANDISHYAVYRGSSEAFVPSVGNRVAVPIQAEWFDGSWRWSSSYYYKISAVDIHGNESGFALVRPSDVTGSDTPKAPAASYLNQNYPNPFNPQTRIAFGLSAPGHVSLRIFDAAGRLVRVLVNEDRREGRYEEIWDGRDAGGRSVSSGIYFYRLRAGAFEATKKMILVR
jgi:hypothetical protein